MIDFSFLKEHPELAKSLRLEISGSDLMEYQDEMVKRAIEATKVIQEEYLTPQQYADTLQITLVTLWSWDRKGITRPLRIGSKKLYRRSDLEKIMSHEK